VRVLGQPVRAGGGRLRRRIGFLPGDLALFPDRTGAQTLDLLAGLQGRPPLLREEVLETLSFPRDALRRKVSGYSTGMRQKLGVTAATQHDPELLVLDEPTSGLDPVGREHLLALLRRFRERGRTVFLSSHVLDEVERTADRVGFLDGGFLRLVAPVQTLRERRPRRVSLRYADGTVHSYTTTDPPERILAAIDADHLVDLEVRPASLDEVFLSILGGDETREAPE
jgi:ABC-2 type transport system ATP-binding protein